MSCCHFLVAVLGPGIARPAIATIAPRASIPCWRVIEDGRVRPGPVVVELVPVDVVVEVVPEVVVVVGPDPYATIV